MVNDYYKCNKCNCVENYQDMKCCKWWNHICCDYCTIIYYEYTKDDKGNINIEDFEDIDSETDCSYSHALLCETCYDYYNCKTKNEKDKFIKKYKESKTSEINEKRDYEIKQIQDLIKEYYSKPIKL